MNQARTHGEDGERRRGEQEASDTQIDAVIAGLSGRPIVLVGMMGAGKDHDRAAARQRARPAIP